MRVAWLEIFSVGTLSNSGEMNFGEMMPEVFRALCFVASRIEISLHVGKCLRTEDIFGRENVSTVRRGRRSRVVKERAIGNERDSQRCKSPVAITKRFLFVCVTSRILRIINDCRVLTLACSIIYLGARFIVKMMNWRNVHPLLWWNLN